ncbi:MAG: hypothetical protein H0X45_10265, partial [Planctomycetes bacterium]|nr:hypothetical protein [Planctomycetota bacterium]
MIARAWLVRGGALAVAVAVVALFLSWRGVDRETAHRYDGRLMQLEHWNAKANEE